MAYRRRRRSVSRRRPRRRSVRRRGQSSYKTKKRASKRVASSSDMVRMIRNPFHVLTNQQPHIPDGKTHVSSGVRVNGNFDLRLLDIANANDPGGTGSTKLKFVELVLLSGINGQVLYRHVGDDPNIATEWQYMEVQQQCPLTQEAPAADDFEAVNIGKRINGTVNSMLQWRSVSCGLNISCINNANEEAGWWEAIRLHTLNDTPQSWGIGTDSRPGIFNDPASDIESSTRTRSLPFLNPTASFINSPSYQSGKLKDLHQLCFKLKPSSDAQEFTQLYENDNASKSRLCPTCLIDQDMGAVAIRVYSSSGIRLLLQTCFNAEVCYDETSLLHSTSTRKVKRDAEIKKMKAAHNMTDIIPGSVIGGTMMR